MNEPVHVLHVDDDAALLDIAATFLERADDRIRVTTETDPTKVVDIVGDRLVDCIVSDYDMPEMTGLDLLQQLQSRYPEHPFVLFTGTQDADVAVEALNVGATDYCRKQVGTEHYRVLAARIVETVRRHRERGRLERERDELQDTMETFSTAVDTAVSEGEPDAERVAALRRAHERLRQATAELDAFEDDPMNCPGTDMANPFSSDD